MILIIYKIYLQNIGNIIKNKIKELDAFINTKIIGKYNLFKLKLKENINNYYQKIMNRFIRNKIYHLIK